MKLPVLALGAAALLACGHTGSRAAIYPTTLAHGRSEVCPDGVKPAHEHDPVVTRCAYEDSIGDGPTRLGGRVTGEVDGGLPGPGLSDMVVTVHRVERGSVAPGVGEQVARARTDEQGKFHLSATFPAGQYDVVARASADGSPLAHVRLQLEGDRARRIEDLRLVVPVDRP